MTPTMSSATQPSVRLSKFLIPTLKEAPAEAEVPSHILMVRGGYLRKVAAGIYSFLPLGWRVLQKITRIVREEMNRAGAQEVFLPAVIPAELWQESGRWDQYGAQLLRLKDRKGGDFVIGPTHEEVIVDLVRGDVRSYRQLPLNLYQIQTKFRDELRPRAGLMRGREFIMKDAYSFHTVEEDAQREYTRTCTTPTGASSAAAGWPSGRWRRTPAPSEARARTSSRCWPRPARTRWWPATAATYAANVEEARVRTEARAGRRCPAAAAGEGGHAGQADHRGGDRFLKVPPTALAKTLIYLADGKPVARAGARGPHGQRDQAAFGPGREGGGHGHRPRRSRR